MSLLYRYRHPHRPHRADHGTRLPRLLISSVLILVCCVGSVAAERDDDIDQHDDRDRREEILIQVNPDVRIDIEIISGSIEIRGWDQSEVRIRTDRGDVDALDISSDADLVTVRASRIGIGWLRIPIRGGNVDLRIDVPKGSYVKAKTINGPIEARDVEGRVSFHAANGKIEVHGSPYEASL